jgi:hypothetical protein
MNWFIKTFGANWKTNTAAAVSFLMGVPALVTAVQHFSNHQPADWYAAIFGIVLAAGFAVSKDATNHSTVAQVQAATITADAKADAAQAAKESK